jgi:tripartite-type tricarboxylate transporter receptor subunit TctC
MRMQRRVFIAGVAQVGALAAVGAKAQAAWPAKPVRLVVPYAPSGSTDVFARIVAEHLTQRLGQQVYVENKPGAGATLGSDFVARAAPDGYTLLLTTISGSTISPHLYKTVTYDGVRDFTHISLLATNPSVLVVNPAFPVKTLPEYVDYARKNPGKLGFATSGPGSSNHLLGVVLQQTAKIAIEHIPYRGAGPAMQDTIAGQVQSMFDSLPSATAHIRAGTVRAIATSGRERNPAVPDVPTMVEQGYPDLVSYSWFGVAGPAKLPQPIVDRIAREVQEILKLPPVVERWKQLGADASTMTPAEVTAFAQAESDRWKRVVETSGAKPE